MDTGYLFKADGQKVKNIFYCGSCNRIGYDEATVERCCRCSVCGEPLAIDKNEVADVSRHAHDECEQKRRAQREAERLEKAVIAEGYDGWIYCDGIGYNDGYFESVEDLLDYLAEGDEPIPEYAFCCHEQRVINLDADRLIEDATEDSFEDADSYVKGREEFAAAVEAFNKANETLFTYTADFKRKVRIKEAK